MKVYELMAALSELPSGAEVYCSGSLSVNDLRKCITVSNDHKEGDMLRSVIERLDGVDAVDEHFVYLNF